MGITMVLAMLAANLQASAQQSDVPMYGMGGIRCSALIDADFAESGRAGQWVLGYVSGVLAGADQATRLHAGSSRIARLNRFSDRVVLETVRFDCRRYPRLRLQEATNTILRMTADRR